MRPPHTLNHSSVFSNYVTTASLFPPKALPSKLSYLRRQAPGGNLFLPRLRRRGEDDDIVGPHQWEEGGAVRGPRRVHPHVLAEARAWLRGEIRRAEGEGGGYNRMHFGQRRLRHEGM